MEALEGTTIELLYKRRLRSLHQGYIMVLVLAGILAALPFIRVDLVCLAGGSIVTAEESQELRAPQSGRIVVLNLEEGRHFRRGDTLLVYEQRDLEHRECYLAGRLRENETLLKDLRRILAGKAPLHTESLFQSVLAFRERDAQQASELSYLGEEYHAAKVLYEQKLVPRLEFEKTRSAYESANNRRSAARESFLGEIHSEAFRIEEQIQSLNNQIDELRARMDASLLRAPVSGTLSQCQGIAAGSEIIAGSPLARITPDGPLLALCFVPAKDIGLIRRGMEVRIRIVKSAGDRHEWIALKVDGIDPEALIIGEESFFRIRCFIDESGAGSSELIPGMQVNANIVLERCRLTSLIFEKIDRSINPRL